MPYANLPGNLQMHYYDDDFTAPWRTPETVIFHHGQGKNGRLLYGWVPKIADAYRVIRVDARGFGGSSVPEPGYAWSLDGFADDLRNLMDHLGIAKAHLVGETIGGCVSIQFALRYPERVLTLTTCTTPFNFVGVQTYVDFYNLVRDRGVEAWARETGHVRLEPGRVDPEFREWYIQQMGQTSQQVVLETLAYLGTVDMTPVLPKLNVPSLAIAGEHSGSYLERTKRLAALIPGCRMVEVPGVGGFAQHEAQPECAAIWREFVASVKEGARA